MLGIHLTFGPLSRDLVEHASKALNVRKALAGSCWGFTTETLLVTYKAIVPLSGSPKCPLPTWTNLK